MTVKELCLEINKLVVLLANAECVQIVNSWLRVSNLFIESSLNEDIKKQILDYIDDAYMVLLKKKGY